MQKTSDFTFPNTFPVIKTKFSASKVCLVSVLKNSVK